MQPKLSEWADPPAVAGTLPLVSRATSPAGSIHPAARNIEYGVKRGTFLHQIPDFADTYRRQQTWNRREHPSRGEPIHVTGNVQSELKVKNKIQEGSPLDFSSSLL